MRNAIYLDNGTLNHYVVPAVPGVGRAEHTITAGLFDTLGTLAQRGYGHNSSSYRAKIASANPHWKIGDTIHVPH